MVKCVAIMVYKLIFKIGQFFRNPSLTKNYLFLKDSEKWSLKELEYYQLTKLKELVAYCYANTTFYKNSFDKAGLKPSDIVTLADIKKIPIITKEQLIAYNTAIHSSKNNQKKFKASTSGTSGTSLTFWKDEHADSFNRASIFRGYSWFNVKPWERNLYFWGFQFSFLSKLKCKILDGLQNRFRIFSFKEVVIKKMIPKINSVTYIHGYSSMIYEVAKIYNAHQLEKPKKIKMVKGTSEKVFVAYQDAVKKAFGVPIINEYGAAETGIIAFECPKGKMHINMEGVIVEEINKELVVTNLQQTSFPIIRYKLGDYVILDTTEGTCSCGMKHQVIKEVTGRIGKIIYGRTAEFPSLYFYYIFKNLGQKHQLYLNYQVQQHKKGHLTFLIEQQLTGLQQQYLSQEIIAYFENDIVYEIKSNQHFTTTSKKQESFISTL